MAIEESTNLIIQSLSGDATKGGWQASASFANDQEKALYARHVEIYNKLEGGGVWEDNYKISIDGSILPQSVVFDRRQSQTSVTISTSDTFLSNAGFQGVYFVDRSFVNPPYNPHQIENLNLGKVIKHIVEGHTNIADSVPGGWVDTFGIDTLHSTSIDVITVRNSNSIWQTLETVAKNEFYVRYFTKQDKLIYEPHPQYKAVLPDSVLTLDTSNIVGQPEVIYRTDVAVDQAQLYAITDAGVILTSEYPSNIGTDGRRQKFSNLRCNSQSRLDLLAERAYKFLNRTYNLRVTVGGAWGSRLELYDRVSVTYTGTDRNGVSIDWTDKKFWIDTINVTRIGNFGATTELMLEEENV